MPKTALAIRHVAFEDLGSFAAPLAAASYDLEYRDIGGKPLGEIDPLIPDLLIVLGGPLGVYDGAAYPLVADELALLRPRLAANRPTLGICLGAQLIAHALGGRVYPGPAKEIGWAPVTLAEAGSTGPLRHLANTPVLHWHGDTFDLPASCTLLASTELCRHQAFQRGPNLLGLQFHAEARQATFESWLVGHAHELAAAGIDPRHLRAEATAHAPALEQRGATLMGDWLAGLGRP